MTEFVLERLNVNDDEHTLVTLLVEDGTHVDQGTVIAELETSKAAIELEAAASGKIYFLAQPGQVLKVGAPLYRIGTPAIAAEAPAAVAAPAASPPSVQDPDQGASPPETVEQPDNDGPAPGYTVGRPYQTPRPPRGLRASLAATPMDAGTGLAAIEPTGKRSRAYMGDDARKAAEVANLSVVNPSGLVSCLFARCPGSIRRVPQDGIFETNFADLIIYETARLAVKYPLLNAFYDDEKGLQQYETVEVGYSIDVADDLTVYNLGPCEAMSLPEVREAIENAMEAHVTKKVSRTHLTPTTITLTDLSGTGVRHFYPLINGQQSAIIGYSSDADGSVLISLAFDHRAMGGRYVARFLAELVSRLDSHLREQDDDGTTAAVVECAFCGKDPATLRRLRERGLMRIVTPDGDEELCCETCFTTT